MSFASCLFSFLLLSWWEGASFLSTSCFLKTSSRPIFLRTGGAVGNAVLSQSDTQPLSTASVPPSEDKVFHWLRFFLAPLTGIVETQCGASPCFAHLVFRLLSSPRELVKNGLLSLYVTGPNIPATLRGLVSCGAINGITDHFPLRCPSQARFTSLLPPRRCIYLNPNA